MTLGKLRSPVLKLLIAALTLLSAACGTKPRTLSLLDSTENEPPPAEPDLEERRRLQEMQLVRFFDDTGEEYFMPVNLLVDLLTPTSIFEPGNWVGGPCTAAVVCPQWAALHSTCLDTACYARRDMCIARSLQGAALLRAQPMLLSDAYEFAPAGNSHDLEDPANYVPISGNFTLPTQSPETRAAILRAALAVAKEGLVRASTLNASGSLCPATAGVRLPDYPLPWTASGPTNTAGSLLATTLVEASNLVDDVSADAVDAILAAADAQRSESLSLSQGAARSLAGSKLSRAEAAHILVGGDPGLLGVTNKAFCSVPELSGRARAALAAIRKAAPDPNVVKDPLIDASTFLNGSALSLPSGSVALRLSYLDDKDVSSVEDYIGVSTEDFAQARAYLIQEFKAFERSRRPKFVPKLLRNGLPVGVEFYAATRTEPTAPPPEYYAAMARYRAGAPPAFSHEADVALVKSRSIPAARGALVNFDAEMSAATFEQVEATLHAFLAQDSRRGELWYRTVGSAAEVYVHGFRSTDRLRLMYGLEGLLCATTGRIEGQECTQTDLEALWRGLLGSQTTTNTAITGFPWAAYVSTLSLSSAANIPVFVVKPINPNQEVPGGFEYVTGFVYKPLAVNAWYAHAIDPAIERSAGEVLRPSEKWCTRPAVECDGTAFDARLPLENELSDDGDGVESSWKHYLTMAEQASAEAHALGEQYLNDGLELDRQAEAAELRRSADEQRHLSRVEAELETLQTICGTAIDTHELSEVLGLNLDTLVPTATQATCSADSDCCGGSSDCEQECVAQRCTTTTIGLINTQSESEARSRIKECIGEKSLYSYVTLGNSPVCIWTKTDNASKVCHAASSEYPCPVTPLEDSAGDPTCVGIKRPDGVTDGILVNKQLNLFDSGAPDPGEDPCVSLRKLRHDQADPGATFESNSSAWSRRRARCKHILEDVVPPLFSREHQVHAQRIGWRVEMPSHVADSAASSITLDGKPKWSTDLGQTSEKWPCAERSRHEFASDQHCSENPESLFCAREWCAGEWDADWRGVARLNQRMYAATTVLQAIAFDGNRAGIEVPLRLGASTVDELGGAISLNRPVNGVLASTTNNGWAIITHDPNNPSISGDFWHYQPTNTPNEAYPLSFSANAGAATRNVRMPLPNVDPFDHDWIADVLESTAFCGNTTTEVWNHFALPDLPKGDSSSDAVINGYLNDAPFLTGRVRYTRESMSDALELLCEATRGDPWRVATSAAACSDFEPKDFDDQGDFAQVKSSVACRTSAFSRAVGSAILARVPKRAVEGVREFQATGTFPTVGGTMGAQVMRLQANLTRYGELARAMQEQNNQLNDAVDEIDKQIEQLEVRGAMDEIGAQNAAQASLSAQVRLDQVDFRETALWIRTAASCATALGGGISSIFESGGLSLVGSTADCAAAVGESLLQAHDLEYERRLATIEQTIAANNETRAGLDIVMTKLEAARQFVQARARVRSILYAMSQIVTEAQAGLQEVRASLAELETLRFQAVRAIGRATQFQSIQAATTENIDAVLNAKLNVSKSRYHQAHKNAVRLTFLAKRAIEQRLGVHLSELRATMPLVDAPSSWESQLCTAQGIDYEALRDPEGNGEVNLAGAYIGDYVQKLRNTVESYRLLHDFQEGEDQVVASIRDDVLNVRAPCPVLLGNMLTYSRKLDRITTDQTVPGWQILGCTPATNGGVDVSCLNVSQLSEHTFDAKSSTASQSPGFSITWGAGSTARLAQRMRLERGRYRLSWYSKLNGSTPHVDVKLFDRWTQEAFPATAATNSATTRWTIAGSATAPLRWPRHYRIYDLEFDLDAEVAVVPDATGSPRTVGAVMLERVEENDVKGAPELLRPGSFIATDAELTRLAPVCEDTDGATFQSQAWRRGCARLCGNGFTDDCADASVSEHCYWEMVFSLDQRDLEEGRIFEHAGFARGNFNYRIEEIGLNFVGSDVRDCSKSETPGACYAGGFVPYSLKHVGPLFVRNHVGSDFRVNLFTGNIEHARGLGLERYLTNPLSSTDTDLLAPYLRSEFQGRPLDGNFILRVWDEEGIDIRTIKDVQLYMKYRYWTRFE